MYCRIGKRTIFAACRVLRIAERRHHRASPGLPLPTNSFHHQEDAAEQVRRAVEAHEKHFGEAPRGVWPSEGSVCPEILTILARHGIRWIATDDAILARSLGVGIERDPYGHVNTPHILYQPYTIASSVDIAATIPALNRVDIFVVIEARGEQQEFNFTENWESN